MVETLPGMRAAAGVGREEPASAQQPAADVAGVGGARGGLAAVASGLGSREAASCAGAGPGAAAPHYDPSDLVAEGSGARAGSAPGGRTAVCPRGSEPALANGFQGDARITQVFAAEHAGRPQPVPGRADRAGEHAG